MMTPADPTHAECIRDAAFSRLETLQINGQLFTLARKAPIRTLQVDQLPAFACFILSENERQRGDVTLPQFTSELVLGFSYTVITGDPNTEEMALDLFVRGVKATLLTDPSFLQMFEFVTSVTRENELFRDGEAYLAEVRMRMTVTYPTVYPPSTTAELQLFSVRTDPPNGTAAVGMDITLEG